MGMIKFRRIVIKRYYLGNKWLILVLIESGDSHYLLIRRDASAELYGQLRLEGKWYGDNTDHRRLENEL
jgi:hypothetical protein